MALDAQDSCSRLATERAIFVYSAQFFLGLALGELVEILSRYGDGLVCWQDEKKELRASDDLRATKIFSVDRPGETGAVC